ncbi:MAG: TonB-dependent receptor [Pseudomonadota bacterium]|nr:TonB-dependent receptor [Pseudomonadota bacterium]
MPTLVSLLFASVAPTVAAQQVAATADDNAKRDDVYRETITVTTGSRTPKAVDKIPGAVTVITEQEIAQTRALTEDATAVLARTVPGYSESSQALSNSGETLRGRIAQRLFDGIPQNSPLREGNRSGTFTDMGIIGRIEVINGPSASEGIGASGGIINYLTKMPTKPGTEVTLTSKYQTQFKGDSGGYKFGLEAAHLEERFDLYAATQFVDRGIAYDGHGRRVGLNTSGSLEDSESKNLFLKVGTNFGEANAQRLQLSLSRFRLDDKARYVLVDGDRATGATNTSERGQTLGSKASFNDFKQAAVAYTNNDLFGGTLSAQLYRAIQSARFEPENGADRQDPLIAPLGTLVDQSEIKSEKKGLRTAYTRPDFVLRNFELRFGVDLVEDITQQSLALTNRLWVPPMDYKSVAPWVQGSYDYGPLTLTAGLRREDGQLSVDDYTTTYFRNRVFVKGGKLSYTDNLPNYGAIWRLPLGFSVFGSYSKGFSLPNVGIPLRNINYPGQSVAGILDLQAIIVSNREAGFNWRGPRGSFSASYYRSYSDFGVSLAIDPITNDFVLRRLPIKIQGVEAVGDYNLLPNVKVGALYSHIWGRTVFTEGGSLDRELGVLDINPDKIGTYVQWGISERTNMRVSSTTLLSRDINVGKSGEEHTRGYTLFDLSASYDLRKYGALTLGVENVFNKFYILSWSQVEGFRNYTSGRGRVVALTHTLKF